MYVRGGNSNMICGDSSRHQAQVILEICGIQRRLCRFYKIQVLLHKSQFHKRNFLHLMFMMKKTMFTLRLLYWGVLLFLEVLVVAVYAVHEEKAKPEGYIHAGSHHCMRIKAIFIQTHHCIHNYNLSPPHRNMELPETLVTWHFK